MGPNTIIGVAAAVLSVAACSSDGAATPDATEPTAIPAPTDGPEPTDAPAPTEPPAPTDAPNPTDAPAPTEPAGGLPTTPVVGMFANAYDFQGGSPDPALLPAQLGDVEAHWYRAGSVLAVIYVGLDASVDACPGNSALVGGGFDFVSNAELPNGSCPAFSTRIENSATQGVQICDGRVGYLTLIPTDTTGQVFASIEKPVPDIGGVGLTSAAILADPTQLPEIDPAQLAC